MTRHGDRRPWRRTQPAAARQRTAPGERVVFAIEEADPRLHFCAPGDLLPLFDEAGAHATRRRIEDQSKLHL